MSIAASVSVKGTGLQQSSREQELKKACQEFESVFTYELLKSMRATVDKCDLFHGGEGEDIYESMLDQELSKSMSGYGGNSLSALLYQQLSRIDAGTAAGNGAYSDTASNTTGLSDDVHAQPRTSLQPVHGGSQVVDTGDAVSSEVDLQSDSVSDASSEKGLQAISESEVLSAVDPQIDSVSDAASTKDVQPEWPLKSVVSSRFGMRKDPFTATDKFHSGIDIAAAEGTGVKAAMSGEVVMSNNMKGYGNVIAIDHGGGIVTIYAHNEKNLVKVGDRVEKGEVISRVGSTGRSTGPHLHFEVRKDGTKIDPANFLGLA